MADEFTRKLALDALEVARGVERDQSSHEDLCAERYKHIGIEIAGLRAETAGLRGIFKWMGGAAFTLIMFGMGVVINQTSTANQTLVERNNAATIAATRIELLQDALQRERQKNGNLTVPAPTTQP